MGRDTDIEAAFEAHLRASPKIMAVLRAAGALDMPDHRLVSGAIYQTIWNALTGRPPDYGIADYDLAYFDPDLSEAAEARWQSAVRDGVGAALAEKVEVVNQARVHVWFEAYFGRPFSPLADTDRGLRRYLSTAHAIGVRLGRDGVMSIAAPYGLDDVFNLILRPNPDVMQIKRHREKSVGVLARWPEARLL